MSASTVARAKFSHDYDHARLEFEARLRRRREAVAKLDAEVAEAYESLDRLLRIIGQSLAQLKDAA
jgi:hypothetical protein